jgi:glycosyltransferase involved in cell wall biosynthesis
LFPPVFFGGLGNLFPGGFPMINQRITFVICSLRPGGAEQVIARMAAYWVSKGWEITILTLDNATGSEIVPLDPRVHHHALNAVGQSTGLIMALRQNFDRVGRLRRAILDSRPDAVISFIDMTNVLTRLATMGLGIPVILSERSNPALEPLGRIWETLRQWLYPGADGIVFQTARAQAHFSIAIQARSRVIPNPVLPPTHPTKPKSNHGPKQVLGLGRLIQRKGHDLLMNAFAIAAADRQDWELRIVGEGEARPELEALRNRLIAQNPNLRSRIHLPGAVTHGGEALAAADLFVLSSYFEGLPNALCEAMAQGLPVISTDCPNGPREMIESGFDGILVPTGDVAALSASLEQLMAEPEQRRQLGEQAQQILNRCGLENIMTQWENTLTAVRRDRRVVFLIRDLNVGGAQTQLVALAIGMASAGYAVTVLHFYADGVMLKPLQAAGIPTVCLDKRSRWHLWEFGKTLISTLRRLDAPVIHGYLGDANLMLALLKPLFPNTKIVWGVRDADAAPGLYGWVGYVLTALERVLAHAADLIILNSHAGKTHYLTQGFPEKKLRVIPNGIDVQRFRPDPAAGDAIRQEWQVNPGEILLGMIGRFDPRKDHPTFLRAAAIMADRYPQVRFVCMGHGPAAYLAELQALSADLGLGDRLIWSPARQDMPAVQNALDIAVLASYTEGFPNVVGEAMACDVPCVVTDVGDAAWIVGSQGEVVPPRDAAALAAALGRQVNAHLTQTVPQPLRDRIVAEFSIDRLVDRTAQALFS